MSKQHFLITDKPLTKTVYEYKRILPDIAESDTFSHDYIIFDDNLSEQQSLAVGNYFKKYKVYALDSCFMLCYEPRLKTVISEDWAKNALDELRWLKGFAIKKLQKQKVFMIASFWLGKPTDFKKVKTVNFKLNDWRLDEDERFEFKLDAIYNFTLN